MRDYPIYALVPCFQDVCVEKNMCRMRMIHFLFKDKTKVPAIVNIEKRTLIISIHAEIKVDLNIKPFDNALQNTQILDVLLIMTQHLIVKINSQMSKNSSGPKHKGAFFSFISSYLCLPTSQFPFLAISVFF